MIAQTIALLFAWRIIAVLAIHRHDANIQRWRREAFNAIDFVPSFTDRDIVFLLASERTRIAAYAASEINVNCGLLERFMGTALNYRHEYGVAIIRLIGHGNLLDPTV